MTLTEAIEAYITLKRSLGAVFSADTRILRSFARAIGDIAVQDIDLETTREFCRGKGAPTRWWERKDETLRGFFAWLVKRESLSVFLAHVPPPPGRAKGHGGAVTGKGRCDARVEAVDPPAEGATHPVATHQNERTRIPRHARPLGPLPPPRLRRARHPPGRPVRDPSAERCRRKGRRRAGPGCGSIATR